MEKVGEGSRKLKEVGEGREGREVGEGWRRLEKLGEGREVGESSIKLEKVRESTYAHTHEHSAANHEEYK